METRHKYKVYSRERHKIYDVISIDFREQTVTYFLSERIDYPDGSVSMEQGDFNEKFEDIILLQFTGLKDKNGKEIYEGDIVTYQQDEKNLQVVEYKTGYFFPLATFHTETAIKVIGNIYENPELLNP